VLHRLLQALAHARGARGGDNGLRLYLLVPGRNVASERRQIEADLFGGTLQKTKKLQKGSKQTKKGNKNDTVQYFFFSTHPHF
jgi:hypothetical protein